ncbi:hypothetical protein ABK040_013738 [Willaertia magna]
MEQKSKLTLALLLTFFLIISFASCFSIQLNNNKLKLRNNNVNNRPIIGVFAQPTKDNRHGNKYLAASYVKFLESAGARVVPIEYDLPESELRKIFESVNGVLFPGGGTALTENGKFTKYLHSQSLFVQWSKEAFERNNDYFPIWGTCLGMESLSIVLANDPYLLSNFDSHNVSLPLNFTMPTNKLPHESKIFNKCPENIINILANQAVTLNNHFYGVEIPKWNQKLNGECTLLSTNKDKVGKEFISLYEHKRYPFYGSQFHPEKAAFEWFAIENINHSFDSVIANQYFGMFFVNECRKNFHRFKDAKEEERYLIYNYHPVFTGAEGNEFIQIYFFK